MSVDTNGFLYGNNKANFNLSKLVSYLESAGYTDVRIRDTHDKNYHIVTFNDGKDGRNLSVFTRYTSYKHEGYPKLEDNFIILFSFGNWGNSISIMKGIVSAFGGGYILENDCNDDYYLIEGNNNKIPEITFIQKIKIKYNLDDKTACEWKIIYDKVKEIE